jgi:hypothetical protein
LRASVDAASTASGEPNAASSARAASRPTPGVSSRRSHAENSSRSIMCRHGRRGDESAPGTPCRKPFQRPGAGRTACESTAG